MLFNYYDMLGVYVLTIDCEKKSNEEIWELIKKILAIPRDGEYFKSLEVNGRMGEMKDRFFDGHRIDIIPGEFAIKFSESWVHGTQIGIFSRIYHGATVTKIIAEQWKEEIPF